MPFANQGAAITPEQVLAAVDLNNQRTGRTTPYGKKAPASPAIPEDATAEAGGVPPPAAALPAQAPPPANYQATLPPPGQGVVAQSTPVLQMGANGQMVPAGRDSFDQQLSAVLPGPAVYSGGQMQGQGPPRDGGAAGAGGPPPDVFARYQAYLRRQGILGQDPSVLAQFQALDQMQGGADKQDFMNRELAQKLVQSREANANSLGTAQIMTAPGMMNAATERYKTTPEYLKVASITGRGQAGYENTPEHAEGLNDSVAIATGRPSAGTAAPTQAGAGAAKGGVGVAGPSPGANVGVTNPGSASGPNGVADYTKQLRKASTKMVTDPKGHLIPQTIEKENIADVVHNFNNQNPGLLDKDPAALNALMGHLISTYGEKAAQELYQTSQDPAWGNSTQARASKLLTNAAKAHGANPGMSHKLGVDSLPWFMNGYGWNQKMAELPGELKNIGGKVAGLFK